MEDTLSALATHLSFAETHQLSNGEIFLIGFLGVIAFMLLLIVCMKLSTAIARHIDQNNEEKE